MQPAGSERDYTGGATRRIGLELSADLNLANSLPVIGVGLLSLAVGTDSAYLAFEVLFFLALSMVACASRCSSLQRTIRSRGPRPLELHRRQIAGDELCPRF
jgi:hypothetical protein